MSRQLHLRALDSRIFWLGAVSLQAKIDMRKKPLALVVFGVALVVASCGRDALLSSGTGEGPSQTGGAGGSPGVGGSPGFGGAGGSLIQLPTGLGALLGDSPVICGPEARLGAPCSSGGVPGCLLPSLGGVCACVAGTYVCPLNTTAAPSQCPAGAATGTSCTSPLSTCVGGSGVGCICGVGTYVCL